MPNSLRGNPGDSPLSRNGHLKKKRGSHAYLHHVTLSLISLGLTACPLQAWAVDQTITTTTIAELNNGAGATWEPAPHEAGNAPTPSDDDTFGPAGSCEVQFQLLPGNDWVDLRFIAAYDRKEGRFAGSTGPSGCHSSGAFESFSAENYSGVLQIALANHNSYTVVVGPRTLATCIYEYRVSPPAVDDFILQVQGADTIIPIAPPNGPPELAVTISCN